MNHPEFTPFLRRILLVDAATCVLTGIVLIAAAGTLERFLAIPAALAYAAGAVLLIFAAGVGYVAARNELWRAAVWWIVALNGAWAVASIVALVAGWLEPNALGTWFVVLQAIAVAVIAELQVLGLRRARQVALRA